MNNYLANKSLGSQSMSVFSGDLESSMDEVMGNRGTKTSTATMEDKNDMFVAFQDPDRMKLFRDLAEKHHCVENIDFIISVYEYTVCAEEALMKSTCVVGDDMKETALGIYNKHVQVNSTDEVNVSFTTRGAVEKQLLNWPNDTMLTKAVAQSSLATDKYKRAAVFAPVLKEISDMLYQNLWKKFRIAEAEIAMAGEHDH
jgi:hypothetical protein